MSLLDFILNLAALLVWLNWRSARFAIARPHTRVSIANNLQRTSPAPASAVNSAGLLVAIVCGRGIFYHLIGPSLNWVPALDLLAVNLPWRSDSLLRMMFFSFTTFFLVMFGFYSWLLLLSTINRSASDSDIVVRWVRQHLGALERLPSVAKLLLPPALAALAWAVFYYPLVWLEISPEFKLPGQLWQSSLVLALTAVCLWRWLLLLILLAHMVNTYVYLGEHPLWTFVSLTARNLLHPLKFLRAGKVDLSAIAALLILALCWYQVPHVLTQLYRRLPL